MTTPAMMPRKAQPVRTVTRTGGSQPVCDYIRPNGSACMCEGEKHAFVESVRRIVPVRRNPAMRDALNRAGLGLKVGQL